MSGNQGRIKRNAGGGYATGPPQFSQPYHAQQQQNCACKYVILVSMIDFYIVKFAGKDHQDHQGRFFSFIYFYIFFALCILCLFQPSRTGLSVKNKIKYTNIYLSTARRGWTARGPRCGIQLHIWAKSYKFWISGEPGPPSSGPPPQPPPPCQPQCSGGSPGGSGQQI